jgi:hypothetical protein
VPVPSATAVAAEVVNNDIASPESPEMISLIHEIAATRRFAPACFDGMSKINDLERDLNRVDFRVPFGGDGALAVPQPHASR